MHNHRGGTKRASKDGPAPKVLRPLLENQFKFQKLSIQFESLGSLQFRFELGQCLAKVQQNKDEDERMRRTRSSRIHSLSTLRVFALPRGWDYNM